MHVIGGELWVREFVLLQRLPHTCINVGFVVYVEPQNMTIFSDRYNKGERRCVGVISRLQARQKDG